jgi:hypothetical protein
VCDPKEYIKVRDASAECCCPRGEGGIFVRRYMSSKEHQDKLEAYKDLLEKELEGVEERIQKLKNQ